MLTIDHPIETIEPSVATSEPVVRHTSKSLRSQILRLIKGVNSIIVGRETEVMLIVSAIAAQEHALLWGEPGEGKSLLVNTIFSGFQADIFDITLMADMNADDVLGGVIFKELEQGKTVRNFDGYLPTSQLAFLDELGKCPASLRTSLMSLFNERTIRNGGKEKFYSPLSTVVAATNEITDDVAGLYDRFALMLNITDATASQRLALYEKNEVSDSTRQKLVFDPDARVDFGIIPFANAATRRVKAEITFCAMMDSFADLVSCEVNRVSTRTRQKAIGVMKAYAWILGDTALTTKHTAILPYLFSADPSVIGPIKELSLQQAREM